MIITRIVEDHLIQAEDSLQILQSHGKSPDEDKLKQEIRLTKLLLRFCKYYENNFEEMKFKKLSQTIQTFINGTKKRGSSDRF